MFTKKYIEESINILNKIEIKKLEKIISVIANVRKNKEEFFFLELVVVQQTHHMR